MYLKSLNNVFGSDSVTVSALKKEDDKNYTYQKSYTLKQKHWKAIDHGDQRCDQRETAVGYTSKCITKFLEMTIGCSMGLQGSDGGLEMSVSSYFV